MRYFSALMAGLVLAACGGDPSEHRDTCHPDPNDARVVVPVTIRNEGGNLDDQLGDVYEDFGMKHSHDHQWFLRVEVEGEGDSPKGLSDGSPFGEDTPTGVVLDTLRGHRAEFTATPNDIHAGHLGGSLASHTVTLDRSCELVIVVSDEWDGERITFHLSHFWR